jgi:hypothetical protein
MSKKEERSFSFHKLWNEEANCKEDLKKENFDV